MQQLDGNGNLAIMVTGAQGTMNPPEATSSRREIGNLGVWSLSSAKPGNGVEQLRDDDVNTFWQSDGAQPHYVNLQFFKKMKIQEIAMFIDFKTDESYTPSKISIRASNSFYEMDDIKTFEFDEPTGWFVFPLFSTEQNGHPIK